VGECPQKGLWESSLLLHQTLPTTMGCLTTSPKAMGQSYQGLKPVNQNKPFIFFEAQEFELRLCACQASAFTSATFPSFFVWLVGWFFCSSYCSDKLLCFLPRVILRPQSSYLHLQSGITGMHHHAWLLL
jgi:hypothetical protein